MHLNCPGSRRSILRLAGLGAWGALAPWRGAAASGEVARPPGFGRARQCILLFLTGGPSQHDTWDPKPDAPSSIRGETIAIPASIPGVQFGDRFPELAKVAHRFCILRSLSHNDAVHTSAGYTVLTGVPHPLANTPAGAMNVVPTSNDHPHVGSLLARWRGELPGIPTCVSLPEIIKDAAVNEFPGQGAGFLSRRYDPLLIQPTAAGELTIQDLLPPPDVPKSRLDRRQELLAGLDARLAASGGPGKLAVFDLFRKKAQELLESRALRDALNIDQEPAATRDLYGSHRFGQGCLLARRLIEAGVSLVTVYWHYEGPDDSPVWDSHWNHFRHLRERLAPPADKAIAALVSELHSRGLLEETLLVCLGEFGRTPKINNMAGRDHWPHVQSILLAGAGVPVGSVLGASDREGAYPAELPVSPADLTATLLHLLGVPPELELADLQNRAVRASDGNVILPLVG